MSVPPIWLSWPFFFRLRSSETTRFEWHYASLHKTTDVVWHCVLRHCVAILFDIVFCGKILHCRLTLCSVATCDNVVRHSVLTSMAMRCKILNAKLRCWFTSNCLAVIVVRGLLLADDDEPPLSACSVNKQGGNEQISYKKLVLSTHRCRLVLETNLEKGCCRIVL